MGEFDIAINFVMRFEVGPFWNPLHPAVANGLINTPANRKAVGYVNDPTDTGGETKFGVAKNANPTIDIKTLTFADAKKVYYQKYWLKSSCDQIVDVNSKIAIAHFDAAVNHGVSRANKMLQTALGVVADGDIGPKTIAAIKNADSSTLLKIMLNIRREFYQSIVRANPSQSKFLNGWLNRINELTNKLS